MRLVIANGTKRAVEDTLYIRGIEDNDGDFQVEVSRDANFADPVGLVWFHVDDGKLSLTKFNDQRLQEKYEHLVNLEDGEIVVS